MIHIGIDPGITGAVVTLEDGELTFQDMPTYQDGNRTRVDEGGCALILQGILDGVRKRDGAERLMVTLEKQQPMPKNGSIASFSTGYSYGVWRTALAILGIPYRVVTSQSWKKALMPGEAKEKDASRIVARRLWPAQTEGWLSRKKDHGRADAALIAEYGRRTS